MTVHIIGTGASGRTALVELPGARITVRVRHGGRGRAWRCDACGRFDRPDCPHAAAVAAALIEKESKES